MHGLVSTETGNRRNDPTCLVEKKGVYSLVFRRFGGPSTCRVRSSVFGDNSLQPTD